MAASTRQAGGEGPEPTGGWRFLGARPPAPEGSAAKAAVKAPSASSPEAAREPARERLSREHSGLGYNDVCYAPSPVGRAACTSSWGCQNGAARQGGGKEHKTGQRPRLSFLIPRDAVQWMEC